MLDSRRALQLIGAVIALAVAVVLVIHGGIPKRADFTGQAVVDGIPVAPELNALAPPFSAQTVDGTQIDLAALRGAPVIINFWATWCEPCRAEMPELQAIYQTYEARGVHILGVNVGESPEQIRAWQQALGLTFDLVVDEPQRIAALYRLRGQPSTYVVSPDGTITTIYYGPVIVAALQANLAAFYDE